jgi:hypothetical protein
MPSNRGDYSSEEIIKRAGRVKKIQEVFSSSSCRPLAYFLMIGDALIKTEHLESMADADMVPLELRFGTGPLARLPSYDHEGGADRKQVATRQPTSFEF